MTARAIVAALAIAALATASATAAPQRELVIIPGQQIGKVRIGMGLAQVRGALGRPTGLNKRQRTAFGEYVEYDWGWGRWTVGLSGRAPNLRVSLIATTTRRERTKERVGVGTPAARVASVYRDRGVRCRTSSIAGGRTFYLDACRLPSRTGNITYFALEFECADPRYGRSTCPYGKRIDIVYEVLVRAPSAPKPAYDRDR